MAVEMAEFLHQTFSTSLKEIGPQLPHPLSKEFQEIKNGIAKELESKKNIWSSATASADYADLLQHLYDLNDALADCRIFVEHHQDLTPNCPLFNPFQQMNFVRKMKRRLVETMESRARYPNLSSSGMTMFPTGRHTSLQPGIGFLQPNWSPVVGFEEQEKKIENFLSDNGYGAIGVYGMSGSGKTTLIQKVLNSQSDLNVFSPIIWVCLSDINSGDDVEFEVIIIKQILCELGNDVDGWMALDPDKTKLLEILKTSLMSKKYLIVFDEVWEKNDFYANLGGPSPATGSVGNQLCSALPRDSGGKIIVTSKLRKLAESMVGPNNLIPMKPLSRENCRLILEAGIGFLHYAAKIKGFLNDSGFVAIGIYGPSNSANTALLRKVLRSPDVVEKFEPIVWMSQSHTEEEDVLSRILKRLLEELNYDVDGLPIKDTKFLEIVTRSSKKYLIVLPHNYWDGLNYRDHELFMRRRQTGHFHELFMRMRQTGDGAVIVTGGKKEEVQDIVGEKNLIHVRLPDLGNNEKSVVTINGPYVTDEIVEQCHGLPLAAKRLAKIIREKGS